MLLLVGNACGQDSTFAWLRVNSNLPESLVMVDSLYAGRADHSLLRLSPGSASIVLVPTQVGAWDLPQPQKVVNLTPGDTVMVVMDFPYQYRIDSTPFGAIVSVPSDSGRVLGTTPLVYSTDRPLLGILSLEKPGYAQADVRPGTGVINRHSVALQLLNQVTPDELAIEWAPRGSGNTWINWAAAGLMLGGGALAVHYKFTADKTYEEYLVTGDPETKAQVDRYDTYSYVALGAMQVGVGVLAIRLAF